MSDIAAFTALARNATLCRRDPWLQAPSVWKEYAVACDGHLAVGLRADRYGALPTQPAHESLAGPYLRHMLVDRWEGDIAKTTVVKLQPLLGKRTRPPQFWQQCRNCHGRAFLDCGDDECSNGWLPVDVGATSDLRLCGRQVYVDTRYMQLVLSLREADDAVEIRLGKSPPDIVIPHRKGDRPIVIGAVAFMASSWFAIVMPIRNPTKALYKVSQVSLEGS